MSSDIIKALNISEHTENVKPLGLGGLNDRAVTRTSSWVESVIAPVDILEQKVVEPTGLLQSLEYTDSEGRFARTTECSCEPPVIESGIRITMGRLEHVDLCNTCELEVVGHE